MNEGLLQTRIFFLWEQWLRFCTLKLSLLFHKKSERTFCITHSFGITYTYCQCFKGLKNYFTLSFTFRGRYPFFCTLTFMIVLFGSLAASLNTFFPFLFKAAKTVMLFTLFFPFFKSFLLNEIFILLFFIVLTVIFFEFPLLMLQQQYP